MSTSNNPYGPKKPIPPSKSSRESLYPQNYLPSLKDHAIRGAVMATGILASTFVVKKVKKDMAPGLTTKSAIPLITTVILSNYLIDYLQRYEYIPYSI